MNLYRPVTTKRAVDLVFEQVRDLIYLGKVKPGDRIPPERELAETMGVSRPTVREAVSRLVNLGLLKQQQGQGTFVRHPAADQSNNPLRVLMEGDAVTAEHLLEVRLGLECNSAVLAARRATEQDIRLLDESLQWMHRQIEERTLGHQEDVYFHMRIAYASKNPIQIQLMKHFYDLLIAGIRENIKHLYLDPHNMNRIHEQHESVLCAIRKRDPQAAFDTMRQHIIFVMDYIAGVEAG